MANKEIRKYYDMASLQVAAEAFLSNSSNTGILNTALGKGNLAKSILPQKVSSEFGISDSSKRFQLIAHQDLSLATPEPAGAETGLESGFSASLFYDTDNEEYTLSFRSTEFDTDIRDAGDIETNLEIANFGWAFSQLHSMEAFWGFVSAGVPLVTGGSNVPVTQALTQFRTDLASGKRINVTGYSLGANLATAFTELHSDSVLDTYLFNGAGTGLAFPGDLQSVWAEYMSVFNDPSSAEAYFGVPPNFLALAILLEVAPFQLSFESSIALNARHLRALDAIQDDVIGVASLTSLGSGLDSTFRASAGFNSKITDIWADDTTDPGAFENVVAATGIRHGQAAPIWYEEQPYFDILGLLGEEWFTWGTGHSIVLLHDSLAVMAMLEKVDPATTPEFLGKLFDVAAHEEHQSLESVVNALARVFGVTPIQPEDIASAAEDFADIELRNSMHDVIDAIQATALFNLFIDEDQSTGLVTAKASLKSADSTSAFSDAKTDFGQFLALHLLTPFVMHGMEASVEQALIASHGDAAAAWLDDQSLTDEERSQGLANYSNQYYEDRTLFLSTLLGRNRENISHGGLDLDERFSDYSRSLFFDADLSPVSTGAVVQLGFGTEGNDVDTLSVSSLGDRIYGLGGDDELDTMGGPDYLDGGRGVDTLRGGDGNDTIYGGPGDDQLYGEIGDDTLAGGLGADTFHWRLGDGSDTILDADNDGDRIVVDNTELSSVNFVQTSENSGIYKAASNPELELVVNGSGLLILVENANSSLSGSITVNQYQPLTGQNFGIDLASNYLVDPPATNYAVSTIGVGVSHTRALAYDRDTFDTSGQDWSITSIRFNAGDVTNYSGGSGGPFSATGFEGGYLEDFLTGDSGDNYFIGLDEADEIQGLAGGDYLVGGTGSDSISGGDGQDIIFGGGRYGHTYDAFIEAQVRDQAGDLNSLDGGAGNDQITGGAYSDNIVGGQGVDRLFGGTGSDIIDGGSQADEIYGDSGMGHRFEVALQATRILAAWSQGNEVHLKYDDHLYGGGSSDTIWGEQGNDHLYGGTGNDTLYGDRELIVDPLQSVDQFTSALAEQFHGNDQLFGEGGDDVLYGHAGDDLLSGGAGINSLFGGSGDDIYLYGEGDGWSRVTDDAGEHTFVFVGIDTDDIGVYFRGDKVIVGATQYNGLQIDESEWGNVRIAVDTKDNVIDRGRLDTYYLTTQFGYVAAKVDGVYGVTESQRNAIISESGPNTDSPHFTLTSAAENVVAVPYPNGGSGSPQAGLSFSVSNIGPRFDFNVSLTQQNLTKLLLAGDDEVLFSGFSGNINGSKSNDRVVGSATNDTIITGEGDDFLIGGGGADSLNGGQGLDTYLFSQGDGSDTVDDNQGETRLEFENVNAADVALYYSANTDLDFRIEYTASDEFTSSGLTAGLISEVSVNGSASPLTIRSDLLDAELRGTAGDDFFEAGDGDDTIFSDGKGQDTYLFSSGDGADTIIPAFSNAAGVPRAPRGDVRLTDTTNLSSDSFSYSANGTTTITYGGVGDEVMLALSSIQASRDNGLLYFSLSSESDPDWIPEIHSGQSSNITYGSYGEDHIIGSTGTDVIMPGYGNDKIEAGDGDDVIYLDEFYFAKDLGGIGHKDVRGGLGNDTFYTPLAQGITYRFGIGDGRDTISYNWSTVHEYELSGFGLAPYDIGGVVSSALTFTPHGEDRLVFDSGIGLDDLRYQRIYDDLRVAVKGGVDSVLIENYFVPSPVSGPINLDDIANGGKVVDTLEVLVAQGAMPENPLRAIVVGGESYDLPNLLSGGLELVTANPSELMLGSEGDDVSPPFGTTTSLVGGAGNNQIYGFGGNDSIAEIGGANYIDAGSGNDEVLLLAGENTLTLGVGDDRLIALAGSNTIILGNGGGTDIGLLDSSSTSVGVTLAEGVGLNDIRFELENSEVLGLTGAGYASFDVLQLTIEPTGEELNLANVTSTLEVIEGVPIHELEISETLTISGAQIWDIANSTPGTFDGTAVDDLLIATQGDDTLNGFAGDDSLYGLGGNDTIYGGANADIIHGGYGNDVLYGEGGNDYFVVNEHEGVDTFVGGAGFDTVRLEDGLSFTVSSFTPSDSIEVIDADPALFNVIHGTAGDNTLDFSATAVQGVFMLSGGDGNDTIVSSNAGYELLLGGTGNDQLTGGGGSDLYFLSLVDGFDVVNQTNTDGVANDSAAILWVDHDKLWFSEDSATDDLVIDVVGVDTQWRFTDWFEDDQHKINSLAVAEFGGDGYAVSTKGIDTLVQAMAAFDAPPAGTGVEIPLETLVALQDTLTSVWQST